MKTTSQVKRRLEYLRGEILAERISYGEIFALQGLKEHISPDDTLLLEWAGVLEAEIPEHVRQRLQAKVRQVFGTPTATDPLAPLKEQL